MATAGGLTMLVIVWLGLHACSESSAPADPAPALQETLVADCVEGGHVRTKLSGGIQAAIDWQSGNMTCEGMPRPNDKGARLRFSGQYVKGGRQMTLTFILGVANLLAGKTGKEMPTNVTLVEEGNGRFFGAPDTSSCWTDISHHQRLETGKETEYQIDGNLYCVSPLPELNGSSDVTLTELAFRGRIDWELNQ